MKAYTYNNYTHSLTYLLTHWSVRIMLFSFNFPGPFFLSWFPWLNSFVVVLIGLPQGSRIYCIVILLYYYNYLQLKEEPLEIV